MPVESPLPSGSPPLSGLLLPPSPFAPLPRVHPWPWTVSLNFYDAQGRHMGSHWVSLDRVRSCSPSPITSAGTTHTALRGGGHLEVSLTVIFGQSGPESGVYAGSRLPGL